MWRVADAVRTLRENIEVVEVDAGTMMLDDDDDDDDAGGLASSSSSPNRRRRVVGVQGENSTLTTSVDDDFEEVHGLRASPGMPGAPPPAAGPVPVLVQEADASAQAAAQATYNTERAAYDLRLGAVRDHQARVQAHDAWTVF